MNAMLYDLRFAVRQLARRPAFTAVAVIMLALGIGPTTAIFSLADATLLDPLRGVAEPERLVVIETVQPDGEISSATYADYADYRDRQRVFDAISAHDLWDVSLTTGDRAERARAAIVSGDHFGVLGIHAELGRVLVPSDDDPRAPAAVAVIGHELWTTAFGADPNVMGRGIEVNGERLTIIGVAPADFRGIELDRRPNLWVPLALAPALARGFYASFDLLDYNSQRHGPQRLGWLTLVGRLAPGVEADRAAAEMTAIAGQLRQDYPDAYRAREIRLTGAESHAIPAGAGGELDRFLFVLMGVVILALIIACANLAVLLLARARTRAREIGVRLALGGGRGALLRQMLTESLVLSGAGALAGVLVAEWTLGALGAFELPGGISVADLDPRLSGPVLALGLTLAGITGLAFGLVPALQLSRASVADALRAGGRGIAGEHGRLTAVLVATQVALCLVLLVGSGLFLSSLRNGLRADLGFEADRLLYASIDLGAQGYDEAGAEAFYRELLERVEGLPGIEAATLTSAPFGRRAFGVGSILLEGTDTPPGDGAVRKHLDFAGPGYARTLGLRLLSGRDLTIADFREDGRSALVSRAMAERYWPGQSPIGKRFRFSPRGAYFEVAGVVADSRHESYRESEPFVYIYLPEAFSRLDEMTLVARLRDDIASAAPAVRAITRELDPNLPVFDLGTISDRRRAMLMPQRMGSALLTFFAALALTLAAVGVYGVVAFAVAGRTREIGVRIALGARARQVISLVVAQGLRPVAAGIAIGLVAAFPLSRSASAFLYGVDAFDPLTFVAATAVMTIAGILACFTPARRAATIDPATVLTQDP